MKKLIGLKGGSDGTFFEILASEETELIKYPSIKDGKEIPYELGMSEKEHDEWIANKQKVTYRGHQLAVAGNPVCAEAALKEMGYDAFSSTPTTVDIYDKRGGNREGAGRPITGRKQRNFQLTGPEHQLVKKYVNKIREASEMQANGKLFGDLTEMGVEVYIENGMVIEIDEQNRFESTDSPKNRAEAIENAKRTMAEWKREKIDE